MGANIPAPENFSEQHDNLAELIGRLERRIRTEARHSFGPLGVTPAQVRALRTLHRAGAPLRMSTVADRLGIARRSATDVIEQLTERGLVTRHADATDGRAVVVELTPAGDELLAATGAARQEVTDRLLVPLAAEERALLAAALTRVLTPRADT